MLRTRYANAIHRRKLPCMMSCWRHTRTLRSSIQQTSLTFPDILGLGQFARGKYNIRVACKWKRVWNDLLRQPVSLGSCERRISSLSLRGMDIRNLQFLLNRNVELLIDVSTIICSLNVSQSCPRTSPSNKDQQTALSSYLGCAVRRKMGYLNCLKFPSWPDDDSEWAMT